MISSVQGQGVARAKKGKYSKTAATAAGGETTFLAIHFL
jgi:hypothetical protein